MADNQNRLCGFGVQTERFGLVAVDLTLHLPRNKVTCKVLNPGLTAEEYEPAMSAWSWTDDFDPDNLRQVAENHVRVYLGLK